MRLFFLIAFFVASIGLVSTPLLLHAGSTMLGTGPNSASCPHGDSADRRLLSPERLHSVAQSLNNKPLTKNKNDKKLELKSAPGKR